MNARRDGWLSVVPSCARRELLEETGYKGLGNFLSRRQSWFCTGPLLLAAGAHARQPQELHEMENLTVRAVSIVLVQQPLIGQRFGELTAITGTALALPRQARRQPRD